jgi:ATP-dependent Lon protease
MIPASAEEEVEVKKLPMMPLRDVVVFPYIMTPFVVGRSVQTGYSRRNKDNVPA